MAAKTTPIPDAEALPDVPAGPPPGMVNLADLGEVIGAAVARGIAANSPKKVTFGQYDPHSPFQRGIPKKQMPKLRRRSFQNGAPIDVDKLFPREIDLLNLIDRSGRYLDRHVEVILRNEGAEEEVDIRFNNRTPGQQLELKGFCKSFEDMLEQIVAANTAEDAENAADPRPAPRRFGDKGRAFQESRA